MEVDLPRDALCERAEWHMRCGPDAICDVPTCSVASYCKSSDSEGEAKVSAEQQSLCTHETTKWLLPSSKDFFSSTL